MRTITLLLICAMFTAQLAFAQKIIMDENGLSPVSMKFDKEEQKPVSVFFEEYRKSYPLSEDN